MRRFIFVLICLLLSNTCFAEIYYDTSAELNRTTIITYGSGYGRYETYGQTFFAPNDSVAINSFEFYLIPNYGARLESKAYVYQWDGFKAFGDPIFISPLSIMTTGEGWVQVNTGSSAVVSGSEYVAFFTVSNPDGGASSIGEAGFGGVSGSYAANVDGGGNFVAMDNGLNFSMLTQNNWWQSSGLDMQWKASFSTSPVDVPEPLPVGGLIVLCAWLYVARNRIAGRAMKQKFITYC